MISRYNRCPILNFGEQFGTSQAIQTIRAAVKDGRLKTREIVVNESQRLDTLAGSVYGDGRLWFILAAASNIGWALQCVPGTIVLVPDLNDVSLLIG